MRWISAALVATCLGLPVGQLDAQLSPCSTEPNMPFNGLRYTCTSTSSHTNEHPERVTLAASVWRTRITAHREGGSDAFDVTIDSLSPPAGDPAVEEALSNARSSVSGTGFAVAPPTLVSSSTAPVESEPFFFVVKSAHVTGQISMQSSGESRLVCVGDLGDLVQPPPPLPEAPGCAPGAWKVELRAAGLSGMMTMPISDRLEDSHTHIQTDRYSTLLVTGTLTTSHLEVVSGPVLPCTTSVNPGFPGGIHYDCTSVSHHTVQHDSTSAFSGNAFSTRITGRLSGGTLLFDVTVNTTESAALDDAVLQAFEDARRTLAQAAGSGTAVSGPALLSTSVQPVTNAFLPDTARVVSFASGLVAFSMFEVSRTACVGDLGDLAQAPTVPPFPPCPSGSAAVTLRSLGGFGFGPHDDLASAHIHTQRDVYAGLFVTGTLTNSHYELAAIELTPTFIVPIVLSPTGGSAFTSELTLTNRGTSKAVIRYLYTPAFGGSSGAAASTLPPGQQLVIPDALAYLKDFLTNPGSGGTLRITFAGLSSPDAASVLVRTTAEVPGGRAGLSYPGLEPGKLLSAPVFLSGLRQNATDRSNVAVLNAGGPGDGDITLRLTVFSGDPSDPRSMVLPDVTLSPGGFAQVSGVLVSNGLSLSNGYARVERVSGTAPFYSYAVINDQVTSDGSFVEPVAASPALPVTSMTLPVLVETAGYETELMLTNVSAAAHTMHFTWASTALTGGQATFSISLLPGEQQILPDFVQILRDRGAVTNPAGPSFVGALFASDDSGDLRGVSLAARVTTRATGGRFGVFIPAYPDGSLATTSAWLYGLRQDFENRSNLALVNTGSIDASPSTFRIDLFDGGEGAPAGSFTTTVPARGLVQIDRVLANDTNGSTRAWALVTRTSGNNPFIAYAVLNDGAEAGERSGDGAFVAATLPAP
jgi:hypothetical protein